MLKFSVFILIACKVICNELKFAYNFLKFQKNFVHYAPFQNCLLIQPLCVLSNLVYQRNEKSAK